MLVSRVDLDTLLIDAHLLLLIESSCLVRRAMKTTNKFSFTFVRGERFSTFVRVDR